MPQFECRHVGETALSPPHIHYHGGTRRCFVNNEDSSCPPAYGLIDCNEVVTATGLSTAAKVVIGVAVVVGVVIAVFIFW